MSETHGKTHGKGALHLTRPPPRPDPDPALIQRAQEGDRGSLESLLREISPSVCQWALAYAGDPDAAADLSQEVFMILLRKISSYRGEAPFFAWLFTVTRNQAVEEARRKGRIRKKRARWKHEVADSLNAGQPGGTEVDRERMTSMVRTFVQELPRRQREVFQMSQMQGLSGPEIGRILGIEASSVRVALLKARRALRRKILERHPEFVEEYLP